MALSRALGCTLSLHLVACSFILDSDSLSSERDLDAGVDAQTDAGRTDGGGIDSGSGDGSTDDAQPVDAGDAGPVDAGPVECMQDEECDDGAYCNGIETCNIEHPDADRLGCVGGARPCEALCDEEANECVDDCPSGAIAVLGTCRQACTDTSTCEGAESCVNEACVPPEDVCGACAEGVCPLGTVCRPAAGDCDLVEECDGASTACPDDAVLPSSEVCRIGSDVCDAIEQCDGVSPLCPEDQLASMGTPCRESVDLCDAEERCTGTSAECPADELLPSGATCREATGICDLDEQCDGVSAECPANAFAPNSMVCRPSTGDCDPAERCSGATAGCPVDVLATFGAECRPSVGMCDLAEVCTGTSADCPTDVLRPAGFECRGVAGVCDIAEMCSGSSGVCPTDQLMSGNVCRSGSGDSCDPDEVCNGVSAGCPSDIVASSNVVCRAGPSACNPDEHCTGVAGAMCPADVTMLACPGATTCAGGSCRLVGGGAIIFKSSTTHSHTVSRAQRDIVCQNLATAANLGGTFRALISDASGDARDIVIDRAYFRVDGVKVADNKADMFDGSIDAFITVTETGGPPDFEGTVTGSHADGTRGEDCNNWTVNNDEARRHYGINDTRSGYWISANTAFCFGGNHHYCIQVD